MSSKIYYAKDSRFYSGITLLSHEYTTSVDLPHLRLVQGLQSASVAQRTSFYESGLALTVGDWKHQLKITGSTSQSAKTAFPVKVEQAIEKTQIRIASLGTDNETYRYTLEWLERLCKVVRVNQMWWSEPLVNLGIDSEIVFEWWHENKKLTVYIFGNTAEYIKVWGSDIDNEMEDGSATSSTELTDLWKWLIS
ncbi:hypothetical protein H1Q63_12460 [Desmonostoc muscorum CCALA 125]|nr:hypothetical protein [Desmonostoc muscorum CCALA 125]